MDLKPVGDTTLRVRSQVLQLQPPKVSAEDVQEAKAIVEKKDKAKFMEQVKAYKVLDVDKRAGTPLEVEVQVITMGDTLAWVSLPGEIFVELGLSIKAASPFAQTHIAELANGSIGYIPNRSAYARGQLRGRQCPLRRRLRRDARPSCREDARRPQSPSIPAQMTRGCRTRSGRRVSFSGRTTLPGVCDNLVLDVSTSAITVAIRLRLKSSD